MMSVTKVSSASAQHYYAKEDYYTKSAEARESSAWWGEGAERLGLTGRVEQDQFKDLLEGRLPNGIDLSRNGGDERRAGFDATFSAPKSVSLLAEIGEDSGVREAHKAAVDRALAYIQENAAYARVTEEGETMQRFSGNLVVARFDHHTSRAGDPQLHTHSVILNVTQRDDGEWRALAGDKLFEVKMAAGAVYRSTLALELQQRGYEIRVTHADGRFEMEGITQEHADHFSQRSNEIRAAMDQYGLSGAKDAERATLLTREAKRDVNLDQLRDEWSARAADQGMDLNGLVLQAQQRASSEINRGDSSLEAKKAVQWAIEHTTERQTLVNRTDLERYSLERSVGKASPEDVRQAIQSEERDGTLIRVGDRYTTLRALRTEHETVQMMRNGQARLKPLLERGDAAHAVGDRGLMQGQKQSAIHILSTADRFSGVEGSAGTGKTTMLQTVHEVASNHGFELRGLAVSASAVRTLESESGIPSETIAQFLSQGRRAHEGSASDGRQRVYVVDEASLLGARSAHALMQLVEQEGARAIFLGDRNQLGSIEAGKPFAVLADHGMQIERMTEILRQRDPELKSLVEKAAAGRTSETVAQLEQSGRLVAISDRMERLNMVAQEYLGQSPSAQQKTLVLTGSRVDRGVLNELIRAGLEEQGSLLGSEIRAEVLVQKDLTKAQKREVASFHVGDVVRFGKDYRGLGIVKGEYGRVEATSLDRGTVALRMEADGRAVEWQPQRNVVVEVFRKEERGLQDGDLIRWTRNDYGQDRRNGELSRVGIDSDSGTVFVRDRKGNETVFNLKAERHWDHGYAVTVHASQGRTAERTIIHADSQQLATGKEGWYVAVSRARDDLRVITDDVAGLREAVGESRRQESAIEAVGRQPMAERNVIGPEMQGIESGRTSSSRQLELER
jgi:conjugative relaxase-like TrwC/TraI family protein